MTGAKFANYPEGWRSPEEAKERMKVILTHVFKLMNSLAHESERASVILAVAWLDSDLEKVLKKVLHPCSGGGDNLLDSDRPLGAFSAKITLARRIGVIDHEVESALQILRRMRNEFAHELEASTLSSDRNRDRLTELGKRFEHWNVYQTGISMGLAKNFNISPEHEKMLICVTCIVVLFQIGLNTLRKVDVGTAISI
ncbi:hypothetical protein LGM39_15720 [Burkholderia cepacia]|uniref:hypothetical protein n=1 Tax=Burkholderia cepacia TaxID=292 RepID=UPI001CF13241|nr:hypothetical protein [Burkholderia cepacia]MCA7900827.1 hypothetical protein [Burkholderia cepacia]